MKIIQSSLFRGFCAIIIGVLLIKYRDAMVQWLTIAIGVLFFLSGIISIVSYWSARKTASDVQITDAEGRPLTHEQPAFPLVGIGSLVLGIVLAMMPTTFIKGITIILSVIIILGALSQLAALASARRYGHVALIFWCLPSAVLLISLVAIVYPQAMASMPLFFLGWTMVIYGVVELGNAFHIYRMKRQWQKVYDARQAAQAAQEADDTDATPAGDGQQSVQ